jgi:hypothetical protein
MTELEAYLGGGEWGPSCPRCGWHLTAGRCEVCGPRTRARRCCRCRCRLTGAGWCPTCKRPGFTVTVFYVTRRAQRQHRRLRPRDVLRARQAIRVTRDLRRIGHKAEMRATLAKWRKGSSEHTPLWFRSLFKTWGGVPRWAGYVTRGW